MNTRIFFILCVCTCTIRAMDKQTQRWYLEKNYEQKLDSTIVDGDGQTLLHYAANLGDITHARRLVGQIDVNARDKANITPLHIAAFNNNPDMVNLLVDSGANVDVQNMFGRTPLHDAANYGSCAVLTKILSKKANPNIADQDGMTPLFATVRRGRSCMAAALLAAGANLNHAVNTITPLHQAAYLSDCESIELLLQYGARVDTQNIFGNTPLHDAVNQGTDEENAQATRLLLRAGANHGCTNHKGKTPLHIALQKGYAKTAKRLLSAGANTHILVNDNKVLHDAAYRAQNGTALMLIRYGADINEKNKCGQTPMHEALSRYYSPIHSDAQREATLPVIRTLCRSGADIHMSNNYGYTPTAIDKDGILRTIITHEKAMREMYRNCRFVTARSKQLRSSSPEQNASTSQGEDNCS